MQSSWAAAASPALRPQNNLISPNHHIQQQQQQQQAFMRGVRMPVPQQQQAGLGSQRPLQAQGAQHPWGNLSYESAIKQQLQSAPLSSNSSGVSNTQHHHQAGVQEEQKLTKSQKKNMKVLTHQPILSSCGTWYCWLLRSPYGPLSPLVCYFLTHPGRERRKRQRSARRQKDQMPDQKPRLFHVWRLMNRWA